MNNIILPWNCKTHEKIKTVIRLFSLWGLPAVSILCLIFIPVIGGFAFGGIIISWILWGSRYLAILYSNGDLPSFRCRDSIT